MSDESIARNHQFPNLSVYFSLCPTLPQSCTNPRHILPSLLRAKENKEENKSKERGGGEEELKADTKKEEEENKGNIALEERQRQDRK